MFAVRMFKGNVTGLLMTRVCVTLRLPGTFYSPVSSFLIQNSV